MSEYYDRQGKPIAMLEWAKLFEDIEQTRVAQTELPNGKWISTVWFGIDPFSSGEVPPLIFDTAVFPSKDGPFEEMDCERYSTEADAIAGHKAMCAKWSSQEQAHLATAWLLWLQEKPCS
jgi:hypothetical protein